MILLHSKDLVLGTWSQIASPEIIDIVGAAGFAFTIIDCEHGYFGLETAENLIRACNAARIAPWVRAPKLDPQFIGKALDCGAQYIVVPGISSGEQAAEAVAAGRFAPDGTRGACPCVRAGGHYIRDWKAYVRQQHAETGIIALVETRAGLDDFDRIIATPGLAGLLIGPFDLSVSLGFEGDYLHPDVQLAVGSMITRAQAHGVPVIMPVFSPDIDRARAQLGKWQGFGLNLFVVGTDKILIADQMVRYSGVLSGSGAGSRPGL
jgi:4-hydroxy-2-oxoheptanedioate aldolase